LFLASIIMKRQTPLPYNSCHQVPSYGNQVQPVKHMTYFFPRPGRMIGLGRLLLHGDLTFCSSAQSHYHFAPAANDKNRRADLFSLARSMPAQESICAHPRRTASPHLIHQSRVNSEARNECLVWSIRIANITSWSILRFRADHDSPTSILQRAHI
jgi:hypothetical protein